MILRITCLVAIAVSLLGLSSTAGVAQPDKKPKPEDQAKAKKALQDVQDFIGVWNLEGTQKVGNKTEAWKEQVSWGWKFKDGDAWIHLSFAEGKGKYFLSGELRYDVAKKKYVLTLTPSGKDVANQEFVGDFTRGTLKLDRKDEKSGDVHRITMNTIGEDSTRFALKVEKQDGGKGLFNNAFAMTGNKEGTSFAGGGAKKPECIVSGGSASMAVQYNGKTYYVCCSGCRDEFNANPKKYVK